MYRIKQKSRFTFYLLPLPRTIELQIIMLTNGCAFGCLVDLIDQPYYQKSTKGDSIQCQIARIFLMSSLENVQNFSQIKELYMYN